MIKLYKINYSEDYKETNIEYIDDVIFNNKEFKSFKGPVSCIIQSNDDSSIVVTCWDGNIYRFDKPDLSIYDNYFEYENEFKDNMPYEKFF